MPNLAQTPLSGDGSAFNLPTVRIRNKSTGEVRNIPLDQAPNFGISLEDAVARAAGQREAEKDIGTFKETGEFPSQKEPEGAATAKLRGTVKAGLEALGRIEGVLEGDPDKPGLEGGFLKLLGATTPGTPFGRGMEADILSLSDAVLRIRTGAAAPETEVKRFAKIIAPHIFDPAEVRQQKLDGARSELEEVASSIGLDITEKEVADMATGLKKKDEVTGITQIPEQPQEQLQEQPLIQKIAGKAAEIAPTAGGILGGIGGTVFGLPGAIAGAAVGGGVGEMVKQTIRRSLDAEDRSAVEQIKDVGTGALREAAFEGVGLGIGKFVLKPLFKGTGWVLKSLVKNIDDLPLRGIRFAPSDITKFARKHGGQDLAEFMINRGYLGEDALEIASKDALKFQGEFDKIALDKTASIPLDTLNERFAQEISKLAGDGKRIVPSVARNIAKKIAQEWSFIIKQLTKDADRKIGEVLISPEELTLFRRTIDDIIPDSQFVDPSIKNINIRLRRIINDTIAEGVGQEKGKLLKTLGKELSSIYDLLEFASKRAGKGRGALVANLPRTIFGGAGGVIGATVGGLPGAIAGGAAGIAGEQLLRDPQVLKQLLRVGRAGQKIGAKISPILSRAVEASPFAIGAASQAIGGLLR